MKKNRKKHSQVADAQLFQQICNYAAAYHQQHKTAPNIATLLRENRITFRQLNRLLLLKQTPTEQYKLLLPAVLDSLMQKALDGNVPAIRMLLQWLMPNNTPASAPAATPATPADDDLIIIATECDARTEAYD